MRDLTFFMRNGRGGDRWFFEGESKKGGRRRRGEKRDFVGAMADILSALGLSRTMIWQPSAQGLGGMGNIFSRNTIYFRNFALSASLIVWLVVIVGNQ